ncbi:Putative actin patch assembly and actin polymerization protein [Komagataella phaffii CBS 7435]|uniref:Protein involved in the organization of the actin cytoskeleton n=2 Tax=Komagataella phaffii TaxID=460519 RepID=C4R5L3_KOMPG|nr:Protein involved in the organization of the actin cytoskeleton [Komagataella phaffii GS115]AOA63185.1 GQ67_03897T0 [Komagataella phaffii]CAH2449365.1 Putative actin patch assembly and actin [Komagataella phaffii CBS 7435]AOA68786.1 GQ68_03871T0 [Komagataella phaffii GS115]CAY70849.1 Protein involved in the organization of the actin cytoskeleton [Komagataella phaffii GS115]CCA39360.1 Putative actin patch assembly and actin polymerization protein [Komagataella phaffii CBS 7435]
MGINNPIPRSLGSECKKVAKILTSFIKPNQVFGPDEVIPKEVLQNARGLAVMTVLKGGFLFSARVGSGLIMARLPNGEWSAPSAIATAGAGVGGQIGGELTDFVFILNTQSAVDSFAQYGSITLGGNVSVAAGPLGRNAEVSGTASLKAVSAVFAYSKTKGLFAGVSLEGSVIVERREANRKFYGDNCKARHILAGDVAPPRACDTLLRVLNSRVFNPNYSGDHYDSDDEFYNDIPSTFSDDNSSYNSPRTGGSRRGGRGRGRSNDDIYSDEEDDNYYSRSRDKSTRTSSKWRDDIYDRPPTDRSSKPTYNNFSDDDDSDLSGRVKKHSLSEKKSSSGASRNRSRNETASSSRANKAIALYSFQGEQAGDLPFKKGDVITIIQKSNSTDDWWTGRTNGVEGIFPANYVELV